MHDRYEVWESAEGVNCLIAAPKVSFMSEFCIYYSMGPHPMQHAIVEKNSFKPVALFQDIQIGYAVMRPVQRSTQ